jgi:hypothetical protein
MSSSSASRAPPSPRWCVAELHDFDEVSAQPDEYLVEKEVLWNVLRHEQERTRSHVPGAQVLLADGSADSEKWGIGIVQASHDTCRTLSGTNEALGRLCHSRGQLVSTTVEAMAQWSALLYAYCFAKPGTDIILIVDNLDLLRAFVIYYQVPAAERLPQLENKFGAWRHEPILPTHLFGWFVDIFNDLFNEGISRVWIYHKNRWDIGSFWPPHIWANLARRHQHCPRYRWPHLCPPPCQSSFAFEVEWLELFPDSTLSGFCVRTSWSGLSRYRRGLSGTRVSL